MKFQLNEKVLLRGTEVMVVTVIENDPWPYIIMFPDGGTEQCQENDLSPKPGAPAMGDVQAQAKTKAEKPRMDLLFGFGAALIAVAEVLTFGAKKYADDSWKSEPFNSKSYLAALGRHLAAIGEGELRDKETGLLHAAHAACDALMYCWHIIKESRT